MKMSASRVPVQRSQGEPPGRECIQVHPRPPIQTGMKKAVMPMHWMMRSLVNAPKRPTQLRTACGPTSPVDVFSEGSEACQVASERSSRSETRMSSIPRKMFRGRLRVGERTMEMGFMGWTLRKGAQESAASEPKSGQRVPKQSLLSGYRQEIPGAKRVGEPG